MRKLVTIRKVKSIQVIKGADFIEEVTVDGWKCVAKKGEFRVGDFGLYFEIDSFLPVNDDRFEFLKKSGTKKIEGFEGIRVRTRSFKGNISQGIILPLANFPEVESYLNQNGISLMDACEERVDFSKMLGVIKYERPSPKTPYAAGNFPSILKKTDEERIQNIYDEISTVNKDVEYYPTLKLDGTSCTIAAINEKYAEYFNTDDTACRSFDVNGTKVYIVVCSRSLQIKTSSDSHYIDALENTNMFGIIEEIYRHFRRSVAVSGEVIGPKIQGNKEKSPTYQFYAFNFFDVAAGDYFSYRVSLDTFKYFKIQHVPLVCKPFKPFQEFSNIDELLKFSDGKSLNADMREGIVYKSDYHGSFKAISNQWLCEKGNA